MTKQKDLKRVVRTRMQKTGESYTAARAQVLKKKEQPKIDYAALGLVNDETMLAKTGRTWPQWLEYLDAWGAAERSHRDIAAHVYESGVAGWWSQTVTVGYERIRGKRAKGQRMNGTWETSKSKTFPVPVETLFAAWKDARKRRKWLDASMTVRSATEPKVMHITWADGTNVDVGFMPKGDAKSSVSLAHTKLPSKQQADEMRAFWGERLDALGEALKR